LIESTKLKHRFQTGVQRAFNSVRFTTDPFAVNFDKNGYDPIIVFAEIQDMKIDYKGIFQYNISIPLNEVVDIGIESRYQMSIYGMSYDLFCGFSTSLNF
jgi:hypothetical protein